MDKQFKASNGVYLTKQLFFEMSEPPRDYALYTFKHEDHTVDGRVYPSFRRLYLEINDETEFLVAQNLFGGWPHFKKLLQCSWFVDYLSEIREELRVRQACEHLMMLREKSRSDTKVAQYLLDKILKEDKNAVGRPTKARIKEEAAKMFEIKADIDEDFKRIFQ